MVVKMSDCEELKKINSMLETCPAVFNMLSKFGKRIFFPENGILAQSWEARKKAFRFNATLGEAQSNRKVLYSETLHKLLSGFAPGEIYPYSTPAGLPELRKLWQEKALRENPSMQEQNISVPVVTCGLTHGLSLAADLFLDPEDTVIVPDKHWENYELIFQVRGNAEIKSYPMFEDDHFNYSGMEQCILSCKQEKVFIVLNFPNNPTGYMPTVKEAHEISAALCRCAEAGKKLVVLCDDAYYGFWYSDQVMRESLFGLIAGSHPSILSIRVDGATKEVYAGGLRVGFITFGGQDKAVLKALEKKAAGAIRASLSSCSHPSQSILLKGLKSSAFQNEISSFHQLLVQRSRAVMKLCKTGSTKGLWKAYPYNSGYFLCIHVAKNAYSVRDRLLDQYGIGVIACSDEDIRISVPCIEIEELKELFSFLDEAIETA
jgi:aspartate/methionine/tyrosine aminotransferase